MSRINLSVSPAKLEDYASVFGALGDKTRLSLVMKLSQEPTQSISQLAEGFKFSRQAVTKHLRILKRVGIVQNTHFGRENLFELDIRRFKDIKKYLEFVSNQWDQALSRLQSYIES